MAAKKGHIEEVPISEAAKKGIEEIKGGKDYVNVSGEYVILLEEGRRRVRRAVNMACIIVRYAG